MRVGEARDQAVAPLAAAVGEDVLRELGYQVGQRVGPALLVTGGVMRPRRGARLEQGGGAYQHLVGTVPVSDPKVAWLLVVPCQRRVRGVQLDGQAVAHAGADLRDAEY